MASSESGDELMLTQYPLLPERLFFWSVPSEETSGLVSFGAFDDDDKTMSMASSTNEDWWQSSPMDYTAPQCDTSRPPITVDNELLKVLSKVIEELHLEWSLPAKPISSCLDEWYL